MNISEMRATEDDLGEETATAAENSKNLKYEPEFSHQFSQKLW